MLIRKYRMRNVVKFGINSYNFCRIKMEIELGFVSYNLIHFQCNAGGIIAIQNFTALPMPLPVLI